jgi:uncharacterized membrane protein
MKKNVTKFVAVNAVIAALYVVFTLPLNALASQSLFQFRPAEALTVLPALAPYTTVGLVVGCALSNTLSAYGIADVLLGSAATLLAGILTSIKPFNKFYLAPLPPVVINAAFLPLIWMIADPTGVVYWTSCFSLLVTQCVVIFGLGIPLYFLAKKRMMPLLELSK